MVCFFIPLPAAKKDPLPYQRATDTHGRAALARTAEMRRADSCVISNSRKPRIEIVVKRLTASMLPSRLALSSRRG